MSFQLHNNARPVPHWSTMLPADVLSKRGLMHVRINPVAPKAMEKAVARVCAVRSSTARAVLPSCAVRHVACGRNAFSRQCVSPLRSCMSAPQPLRLLAAYAFCFGFAAI